MRKLFLTILFIVIIAAIAWWLVLTMKKSDVPKIESPQAEPQPLVTEPPPDATDDLLLDNLDEALQDIEDLEK